MGRINFRVIFQMFCVEYITSYFIVAGNISTTLKFELTGKCLMDNVFSKSGVFVKFRLHFMGHPL